MSSAQPRSSTITPFDWQALRARLEQQQADAALSRDQERETLRRRARELARQPAVTAAHSPLAEHVILALGDERYLVPSASVREAVAGREITPLPGVPPTIRGIAAVRGRVVAVADLRRLFGLPDLTERPGAKLVVIEHRGVEFAIAADEVIVPPVGEPAEPTLPAMPGGPDTRFLRGTTAGGLILLDLAAITAALAVNDEL